MARESAKNLKGCMITIFTMIWVTLIMTSTLKDLFWVVNIFPILDAIELEYPVVKQV